MRSLPIACCACCAFALPLAAAMAQNSARKSRIVGVVGDSINEAPLRGAEVLVSGVAATVTTDSLGRFTIDSLASGTYQVGVFHPLLESLGITLATKPFVIGPDSAGVVHLAVPSAATLVHRYCGAKQTASAPSVVAGLVLDLKAGDLDMIANPDDVIGLEVYQPYDAPAQFQRFDRGCLTLMVWRQVRSKVKQ